MYMFKYIKLLFIIQNLMLSKINKRISKEYCIDTYNKLEDVHLMQEYKKCNSVKKSIHTLSFILDKYDTISNNTKHDILQKYELNLIPPGTKGVIRGNYFNRIIKNKIESFQLNSSIYEIAFEKKCMSISSSEIPDWYIINRSTNKTIIGMNQIDLWSGGHQLNRGEKYIMNDPFVNSTNVKFLCVVCRNIKLKSNKNKIFKIFKKGFERNTICYINNLENIIREYI